MYQATWSINLGNLKGKDARKVYGTSMTVALLPSPESTRGSGTKRSRELLLRFGVIISSRVSPGCHNCKPRCKSATPVGMHITYICMWNLTVSVQLSDYFPYVVDWAQLNVVQSHCLLVLWHGKPKLPWKLETGCKCVKMLTHVAL